MCSLIDFIENENIFIKTELKRIESLRNFLSDFDKQFTTESISQSFGVQNKVIYLSFRFLSINMNGKQMCFL
jgi:hypothetical protein